MWNYFGITCAHLKWQPLCLIYSSVYMTWQNASLSEQMMHRFNLPSSEWVFPVNRNTICGFVWSLHLQTVYNTFWWTSQEAEVESVRVCEWFRRSDIEITDRKEKETESREQENESSRSKMKGRCDEMKADDCCVGLMARLMMLCWSNGQTHDAVLV